MRTEILFFETLVSPHNGYLNLFANSVAALAAHCFPLEQAPYIFMFFGYLFWGILLGAILSASSPFQKLETKFFAVVLTIITPEAFGCYAVSYTHFLSASVLTLLLASQPVSSWRLLLRLSLVLLCGLTGPLCLFLIPLSVFLVVREPNRERYAFMAVLLLCCLIQLSAMVSHAQPSQRFENISQLEYFLPWHVNYSIIRTFAGMKGYLAFGWLVRGIFISENLFSIVAIQAITLLASVGMIAFLYGGIAASKDRSRWILFLSYLSLVICSFLAGMPTEDLPGWSFLTLHNRYFIAPHMLISWITLLHYEAVNSYRSRLFYGSILFVMFSFALYDFVYTKNEHFYNHPRWHDEVSRWRKSSDYRIRISPSYHTFALKPLPSD